MRFLGHRTFLLCEENAPDAIERLGRSSISMHL
nr:MAG TPA: hypothetical protein [Caudoviricetes sp.]